MESGRWSRKTIHWGAVQDETKKALVRLRNGEAMVERTSFNAARFRNNDAPRDEILNVDFS